MRLEKTQAEIIDALKAKAIAMAAALDTFTTALVAAQTSSAAAKVAADADEGADPDTVTAVDDADALIQALDASGVCAFSNY